MRSLVTGAQGAFGRVLVGALPGEVVAPARAELDVSDAAAFEATLRRVRPAMVYHLAASATNDYPADYRVNALGAMNLLESLRRLGLASRVVLFGSAAEYGLVAPGDNPLREDRVLRPVSVYGLTKAMQTQAGCLHALAHGADVVIARVFNLRVPGLPERLFVGRVERFIERFRRGEAESLEVGNLSSVRDYVGGPEALAQVRAIAERGRAGEVYHVASGRGLSMRELLNDMLDGAGVPRSAVREGVAGAGGRSGVDVPEVVADIARTRALAESVA